MLAGCLALLAGAVMTLAAIETASAAAFLAGTAVAGAGVGTGFFLGAYPHPDRTGRPRPAGGTGRRHLGRLLPGVQRPRRGAGVATTHFGLHQTAVVYSAALAVLAAVAAVAAGSFLFRRRSQTRGADPAAAPAGPNG